MSAKQARVGLEAVFLVWWGAHGTPPQLGRSRHCLVLWYHLEVHEEASHAIACLATLGERERPPNA